MDPFNTRYFLSVGDGKSYGPYTLDELRRFSVEGRVTPSSMLCPEGSNSWMSAQSVLGAPSAPLPPAAFPPVSPPPASFGMPMQPVGTKSKIAAGLLGIFLGALGVHNFYLGYTGKGVAQLLLTIFTCGYLGFISWIWGLIEGIMILTGGIATDGQGNRLRD